MPDIFDSVTAPDVFDKVAGSSDIFDRVEAEPRPLSELQLPQFESPRGFTPVGPIWPSTQAPEPSIYEQPTVVDQAVNRVSTPLLDIFDRVAPSPETTQQLLSIPASLARERLEETPDEQATSPLLEKVAQAVPSERTAQVVSGVTKAVADTADFFTSPLGIATLGIGALPAGVQRIVALGFAAQMGRQVPEIATQLGDELGKPEDQRDYQKISQLTTEGLIDTGFTAAGAAHGLRPGGAPVARPENKPEVLPPEPPATEPAPAPVNEDVLKDLLAEMTRGQIAAKPEERPVETPSANAPKEPEAAPVGPTVGESQPVRAESEAELRRQLDEELAQQEEPEHARSIPESTEQLPPPRQEPERIQETGGNVVEQNPPEQPQPVEPGEVAPPAETSPAGQAEVGETNLIDRIVKAARESQPRPTVAERFPIKGSDGKWYTGSGMPIGVRSTGERGKPYYVFAARDGRTYGPRFESREEAQSALEKGQQARDEEFRRELQQMSTDQIEAQRRHWLPQETAPAADVPRPGQSSPLGSGEPTLPETGQPGKPPKVKRALAAGRIFDRESELVGPDILAWLKQNMKLLSKTGAKRVWGAEKYRLNASLWDDAPKLSKPHHNAIYSEHGSAPDRVAKVAYDDGALASPDVDELWRAIDKASKTRAKAITSHNREIRFLEEEAKEHEAWSKAVEKGTHRINTDDLSVGDHFEVEGERVKVVSIDPDTMDVTVEDGRKFGKQVLPSGKSIYVEKLPEGHVESGQEPIFGKPESVEEQQQRMASEEQRRQQTAQRAAVIEKQQKPLVGSVGDIGQGDLLGGGDLLSQPKTIGAGMRAALEKNKQGESGHVVIPSREELLEALHDAPEHFRSALRWAQDQGKRVTDRYKRRGEYANLAKESDASKNRGMRVGNMAGSTVNHLLNRQLGVRGGEVLTRHNQRAREALSFVIESGMDRASLEQQRLAVDASLAAPPLWKRRALKAIQFALANWDRLVPVAQEYNRITDAEITYENAHGIETPRHKNYVHHAQDIEQTTAILDTGSASESGGPAQPFRHIREHATFAEAIAAGVSPRSLDAVDLLQRRITLGQRLVNDGMWADSLADMEDPVTKMPLIQDPVIRTRQDGTEDVTAPPGYELQSFAGRQFGLHQGYTGVFGDLTTSSVFARGGGRQAFMQAIHASKRLSLFVDTYHLGRLAFWNAATRLGKPTYGKGLTLLDNTAAEIRQMASRGEIPQEWVKNLEADRAKLEQGMKEGLNVGGITDNLYAEWTEKIPVLGSFNKWLFQQYLRGAMAECYLIEHGRAEKAFPGMADNQLAREVVKRINTRFGNLQSQGIFKNKTMQDLSRIMFLAPQWNESLIRSELGAMRDAGLAIGRGKPRQMGLLARGLGVAVLGQFLANQLINYMTRGKPTWENEEGKDQAIPGWWGAKISAWIPDLGGGPGFFLNPMSLPLEITHLLFKATERHGGDFNEALKDFMSGRFTSLARGVHAWWTGQPMFGPRPKTALGRVGMAISEATPAPISGGAAYRLAKQTVTGEHQEKFPGQFQKQAMQSFGVKTENAPSPEQRIRNLAVRFNRTKRVQEEAGYHEGAFVPLQQAIRRQNMTDAKAALDDLLEMDKSNGIRMTAEDVRKHFERWADSPFTHSRARENEFFGTLSPEQQSTYRKAQADRQAVKDRINQLLNERP